MEDGGPCIPELREEVAKDERNEGGNGEEEKALLFLDSLDGYLTLLNSLSSTLRQGWLELASARQSMGSSRVSSTLLDLKEQSAATTVLLEKLDEESPSVSQLHFTLSKWSSVKEGKSSPNEVDDNELLKDHDGSQLRHRGSKHVSEGSREISSATTQSAAVDEKFQRQRYKSLSVFGALVSPKLRSAQISFETALEIIAEVANMRSSMLSSFSQLQKDEKCSD